MKLVTLSGLPRSGSTLLGNVLNQHPDITAEMDSCLSDILTNISEHSEKTYLETQHTMKEMKELYYSFMRSGIIGWVTKLCDTEIYLDKDRSWAVDFDLLFNLVPNAKVIFLVRDLRGVVSSLEKLETSERVMSPSTDVLYDFEDRDEYRNEDLMDKRINSYLKTDMIYTPLFAIKEAFDCERDYLRNFKFVTYENFIENPKEVLDDIYKFIGVKQFDNDLNNITQEHFHDASYAPWGNHTIQPKLTPKKENYKFPLIKKRSQLKMLSDYAWFYQYFYPTIYRETLRR